MLATRSIPLVLMAACVAPVSEGEATQDIVGGTQASIAQFPTVVGLLEGGNNWFCTGVLVDKDYVMTSASCFEGVGNQVQVRLDDQTIDDSGGRTVAVTTISKHPHFDINSTTWNHDIAMLKLATPVTDRTPSSIMRQTVSTATQVTQVGFGVSNNNGGGGGVLRSLSTSTIDCGQAGDAGISNANLLCFNASDGTGSCYGDGGAPALVGGAVAGIASGGTSQSCTSGLDLYTALAAELPFIAEFLPQATPPTDPTEPTDPTDPTPPSDDSPTDPDDDDGDDERRLTPVRGCSSGGSTGGLFAIGLALLAIRRRSQAAAR